MSSTRTVSCSQIACRHGPSSTNCCRSSIRLGNSDVPARDSRRPPHTASVMSACSAPGTSSTAARDDGHAALRHTRRSSRRGGDRVGADPCPVRRRRRTAAGRHRRAHDAARGVPVRSPPDARSRRRGGRRHGGRVDLRSRTAAMFSVVACSSKQLAPRPTLRGMGAREVPPEAVAETIDALQPGSDTWQQAWVARDTDAGRATRAPHRDQGRDRGGRGSRPAPRTRTCPTCWNRHRRAHGGAVGTDEAASAVGWQ